MKRIVHSSLALLCLWTLGAASLSASETQQTTRDVAKSKIEDRDQLLTAINVWLREHDQAEWSMNELIGRTAAEFDSSEKGDNPIVGPIEEFLVCLIKDKPFTRTLKLRSNRVTSIQLRKSRERRALPLHYSLALDILATKADLRNGHFIAGNSDHLRIVLATAMAEKQPVGKGSPNDTEKSDTTTPQNLLNAVNLERRKVHLPDFSRDELIAVLADKIAVIQGDGGGTPEIASFLECMLANKRFVTAVTVQRLWPFDYITAASTNKKLFFASHEGLQIEVWEPETLDNDGTPQPILSTKIVVSNYPPKAKAKQERK